MLVYLTMQHADYISLEPIEQSVAVVVVDIYML